jgi:hypothetical protein
MYKSEQVIQTGQRELIFGYLAVSLVSLNK